MRAAQKALWQEMRQLGSLWRVTDLITLGSPLAHLPFLAEIGHQSFSERIEQRDLPASPPVRDGRKGLSYPTHYVTPTGDKRTIYTLHHAACFAVTRWTNIYFEHNGWLKGDPVGGPLQGLFGPGVDDRKVVTRHWRGRLNHLDYWRDDPRDTGMDGAPLAALRYALFLNEGFGPRKPPTKKPVNPIAPS